jgi:hypothetical protein
MTIIQRSVYCASLLGFLPSYLSYLVVICKVLEPTHHRLDIEQIAVALSSNILTTMGFYRTNPGKLVITCIIFSSFTVAIPAFRWYVFASSRNTAFAWMACAYVLPDKAGLPCITAALFIGINAVIQAHGFSGQRNVGLLGSRDVDVAANKDHLRMYHHHGAETYDFINTTALTLDWHNVTVPDSEMDLIVRRLPDGRIHARTQGFSQMGCKDGQCPVEPEMPVKRSRLFGRGPPKSHYKITEIDFSWSEDPGFAKETQVGVKNAALVAADFVTIAKKGTHDFCSSAYSGYGSLARVGFNFYSPSYGADYPKPCTG